MKLSTLSPFRAGWPEVHAWADRIKRIGWLLAAGVIGGLVLYACCALGITALAVFGPWP